MRVHDRPAMRPLRGRFPKVKKTLDIAGIALPSVEGVRFLTVRQKSVNI
jgi:hypothetical protein